MNFKHIVVIGAGTMGTDLSVKFAASNQRVTVVGRVGGRAATFHERAQNTARDLGVTLEKTNLCLVDDIDSVDWSTADLVIENVNEDLALKQALFRTVTALANSDAIITSNSSTFGISSIAAGLSNPGRFFGLHFFMPAHLVPLVEIVASEHSNLDIAEKIKLALIPIGFEPVTVRKDVPGFLANRIQAAMMREVWNILDRDIATAEDVDKAVMYGFGCRFLAAGPIMQKEISGLDVTHSASKNLFPDLNNDAVPPAMLTQKIEKGEMGMKTQQGFWAWTPESIEENRKKYVKKLRAAIEILSDD